MPERLLITPTLLNSWQRIWDAPLSVREREADTVCIEDRRGEAAEKAKQEFLATLRREPIPDNEFMAEGRRFEQACYDGETEFSPIIEGGQFQAVGSRETLIAGQPYLLYGRLDVLKGGVIYDIKRVVRYSPGKYRTSHQHGIYLALFPEAKRFEYLIWDGAKAHVEAYLPCECRDEMAAIADFARWLKANGLWETYEANWKCKH